MTLDIGKSFRKYKPVIIIVVAAAAISTCMLPLTDANGQTLVRSKAASGRAITSNDLFPNGNLGHGSTGSGNVGNFDHSNNINGKTFGNNNGGTVNNGVVAGNNLHGTLANGKVAGNGDSGTVTNGNGIGNDDSGTFNGNVIANNLHNTPQENPPPASPPQ